MNQSDLKALRARLQARQAQDAETPAEMMIGGAALLIFFLIVMFI
jgi:hypothetical protein